MLISILIPSYDEFLALEYTIKKLEKMFIDSEVNIEIIVKSVHYNSDFDIFCKDCKLDIKYIFGKDEGIYDALNIAFQKSKGKFLYCASSSENFHNDFTDIISSLRCTPSKVVTTNWLVDDLKNPIWQNYPKKFYSSVFKNARHGIFTCHQALFLDRSVWIPFNPKFKIIGDQVQIYQILKNASTEVEHVKLNTVIYKRDGLSSYSSRRTLFEKILFILIVLKSRIIKTVK